MSREAITRAVAEAGSQAVRADRLLRELAALAPAERDTGLGMAAAVLGVSDPAGGLLSELARSASPAARKLALELVARSPTPPERALIPILRPLLRDRSLPASAQFAAVIVLLQVAGKTGAAGADVLRSFLTGRDKTQIRELLQALQLRLGRLPALEEISQRLDARLGEHCPRCGQRLDRSELARHVWTAHRLVLDGQEVRDPWAVLDDWLGEAALSGNPDDLGRCFELALHADDARGLLRLETMLVRHGIPGTPPPRDVVWTSCPACDTKAALAEPPFRPLNLAYGRLGSVGYVVEVNERGWSPQLDISTPTATVFQGREPGQVWTRHGATAVFVGPPVVLALLLALTLAQPATAVGGLLAAALLLFAFVQLRWRLEDSATDRAVDHAWTTLVPKLQAAGPTTADQQFIAALAESSTGLGRPQYRERVLDSVQAQLADPARVIRLAADDAAVLQRDPAAVVVRALGRCLEGQWALAVADRLLDSWQPTWLDKGQRERLRVLVCGRAFEAEMSVADLVELGRLAPALGQLLHTDQPDALADLRQLASLRLSRPWESCGEALTAFELADQPGGGIAQLARCPDLLFQQHLTGHDRRASGLEELLVCSRGVVIGRTVCRQVPDGLPPAIQDRVRLWLDYLQQFRVHAQRASRGTVTIADKVRLGPPQPCAHCSMTFYPRPGAVGIAVRELRST